MGDQEKILKDAVGNQLIWKAWKDLKYRENRFADNPWEKRVKQFEMQFIIKYFGWHGKC